MWLAEIAEQNKGFIKIARQCWLDYTDAEAQTNYAIMDNGIVDCRILSAVLDGMCDGGQLSRNDLEADDWFIIE